MAVHNIHMDAVGSRLFCLGDLLAQAEEIGRED